MANMIPNFCISKSPGEPILFEAFQDDDLLKEVTILHSLNIADHVRLPESEADFVCLIPNMGILVIEVKGHLRIDFEHGLWKMGSDKPTTRGPLQQAKEAMYSVRNYLERNGVAVSQIPMFYVAWFPKTTFETPTTLEWESWQYLSVHHNQNAGKWLLDSMASAIQHLTNKAATPLKSEIFDRKLVGEVAKLLRPNFECKLSEKDFRNNRREELVRFADDQFEALDFMRENPRYVISGPAGTGKTLLALEQARRLKQKGLNPLILCFNKNLSALACKENPDLQIMTISKMISNIAAENGKNISSVQDLDVTEISGPKQFQSISKFDSLVIDEAQDIFTSRYLDWLDSILINGLKSGIWYGFGDFDSQRIYGQNDGRELIGDVSNFARGYLGTNCRNTQVIGLYTNQIVPSAPKWNSFRRTNYQMEPKLYFPQAEESMSDCIDEAIKYFRGENFSFDDILILSPNKIANPSQEFEDSEYSSKFIEYSANSVGKIRFSTIHSFKGLESPCVLLIEMYNLKEIHDKDAMKYVALTRATDRLFIVNDEKSKKIMMEYLDA